MRRGRLNAFGDGEDGEPLSVGAAVEEAFRDGIKLVGNFGDEDDIGATGDSGTEAKPTGVVPHDFANDEAMVAGGGGMEAVDGLGGNGHGGVETEGDFGFGDIIIDGFGEREDVEAGLVEAVGVFLSTIAAEADEAIEAELFVIGDGDLGHVHDGITHTHFVGFIATTAEEGTALGEDATDINILDGGDAVFDEAAEAVLDTEDFPTVVHGGLGDAADDRVEAGAIASGGEDTDGACGFCHNEGKRYGPWRWMARVGCRSVRERGVGAEMVGLMKLVQGGLPVTGL